MFPSKSIYRFVRGYFLDCSCPLTSFQQLVIFCCLVGLGHCLEPKSSGLGSGDELRLVQDLFEGYNELIRPVNNMSEIVKVQIQLALHQLIHVDEKNQILKTNVWIRMWIDTQLVWDPGEYGGITVIRIQPEKVWKPDIVLFNNADGKYEVSYKPNVIIYEGGKVLWIPPAIYKSSCTIDVEYFPFDQQECDMKLGSWTFNSKQVVLDWYEGQEKVDLEDYSPSGSWDLMACPGVISEQKKDDNHNISVVRYIFKIRRKTLFYTVNLIVPCVLITFLSVCVFFLPADGLQKMTLCISILLALVVFLVLVSRILPPTSDSIPLLSKYLLFAFIINIFTIFITVVITNWNFRSPRTHHMPAWVRTLFINYLPRVILLKRPRHEQRLGKKSYELRHERAQRRSTAKKWGTAAAKAAAASPMDSNGHQLPFGGETFQHPYRGGDIFQLPQSGDAFQRHLGVNGFNQRSTDTFGGGRRTTPVAAAVRSSVFGDSVRYQEMEECYEDEEDEGCGRSVNSEELGVPMTPETHKAMEAIKYIAAHLKNEDDFSEILDDWRYVASVIDRLMLFIFLAITIGGTIGILINAPHIFEYIDQAKVIQRIKDSKDGSGFDVPEAESLEATTDDMARHL